MAEKEKIKMLAQNRSAHHDFFIDEKTEAGIELFGTEVKSVRQGAVNLKDSYCMFEGGELFVTGVRISPYEKGNIYNKDPLRVKRLLMHKKEILKLFGRVGKEGYTVIPLSLYFKNSKVKVELGLCKGKKLYDKRESDAKRQAEKDIRRMEKAKSRS